MQTTLILLATWTGYITALHLVGGEGRVVKPLRAGKVDPFARGVLLVVWHMVSWALLTLTGAIALAAFSPRFGDLALFAGVQAAGFAVVFAVLARRELGAAIHLPQWLLFGPLALGLLATRTERPAAVAAGVLVGLIGVGHLAWALGAPWPARDREQLAAHVMPRSGLPRHGGVGRVGRVGRVGSALPAGLPSRAMTLAVTLVFLAMSVCLVAPEVVGRFVPGSHAVVIAIATAFALRGVGGLLYWSRRRESRGGGPPSPFFVYNRFMYSPGCLFIAALAAASVTSFG